MSLRVLAPQSIGNFIVGFDCLGAAVSEVGKPAQGDEVGIDAATHYALNVCGPYAAQLPADPAQNIVHACHALFYERAVERDVAADAVKLTLHKNLPVGSGLGSSAASVVATLYGLNEWFCKPFVEHEILAMCGKMEARISGGLHYDNVAPCLRGGLQLMLPDAQRLSLSLPVPDWTLVLCYPGIQVETRAARAALPKQYSLQQLTQFGERLAAFVASMQARDFSYAAGLLRDDIAEPHRAALVPGFLSAKLAATQAGATAFSLSGAGPTCVAVCTQPQVAERVRVAVLQAFPPQAGKYAILAKIDPLGARVVATN